MSVLRVLSLALAAGLCCAAVGAAEVQVMPNVNTGLWDIKSTSQLNGDVATIAAGLMKGVPANQKPMVRQIVANTVKALTAPVEYQQCLSADDLKNGFKPDPQSGKDACTETLVDSSATAMDVSIVCKGEDKVNGTMHFDTPTPVAMTGTIDMTVTVSGAALQITRHLDGTWQKADCGKVKP